MNLKIGKCEFCDQLLVVMDTSNGSVLPVEVDSRTVEIDDEVEFDYRIHKSHLLNCKKQQLAWQKKKQAYINRRNPIAQFANLPLKELCK